MTSPEPESKNGWLDAGLRAAMIGVAVSAGVFVLGAAFLFDSRAALGVAVGGAFALANLWAFARMADAFLSRRGKTAPWTVFALLKLGLLFGGVLMILRSGIAAPLALLVGYGALPVGITFGTLFGPKPPEDGIEPDSGPSDDNSSERTSFADRSREDVLKASPTGPEEPPSSDS